MTSADEFVLQLLIDKGIVDSAVIDDARAKVAELESGGNPDTDTLHLQAMVGMPDGSSMITAQHSGSAGEPEALGENVADQLLEQGAGQIIQQLQT